MLVSSRRSLTRISALHCSCFLLALAAEASFQRWCASGLGTRTFGSSIINVCRFSSSLSLNPAPISSLQLELLERAARVREKIGVDPPSYIDSSSSGLERVLFFQSSYETKTSKSNLLFGKDNHYERGFCNWILPGKVMVGQYPGQTPEVDGPSASAVKKHMEALLSFESLSPIRLFCSLQSELPAQDDDDAWNRDNGMIFLEPDSVRRRFPGPFTWYAPLVKDVLEKARRRRMDENDRRHHHHEDDVVTFLHSPIEDLNIPESQEPFQLLLLQLLTFLDDSDDNNAAIYLHCWGGRGRGGLVGACLLSLIYPTLDASTILDWIQTGYASRLGHDQRPLALSRSPQTDSQRSFVREFVKEYQLLYSHSKYSDNKNNRQ